MSFRPPHRLHRPPNPNASGSVRSWLLRPLNLGLVALGFIANSAAGPIEHTRRQSMTARPTPAPVPQMRIVKTPYLVAIGPTELDVAPIAGPRVRRPPLLPTPKPVEPEPDPSAKPAEPIGPAQPVPAAEPSAFSPNGPPVLLPVAKPAPTPEPLPKAEPSESVLAPAFHEGPDLKDAVIYFETPVGPGGSKVTIPVVTPLTSPTQVPPTQSRATYRKEKE